MASVIHRARTADRARHETLEQLLDLQESVLRRRKQFLRDSQPSGVTDIEEHSQEAERQGVGFSLLRLTSQTVQGIEGALQRLEAGELGMCSECRHRIQNTRLRVLPFAALCLACQDAHEIADSVAH